uniref:G-patch domain-containing protein n=1 Tax=Bracon brevicornis TaxID=1563983 RepID=A0A6V7K291_9HYME
MRRSYKIFVRPKDKEVNEIPRDDHKRELNFRGDEAKQVYEDIIKDTQDCHSAIKNSETSIKKLRDNKTHKKVKKHEQNSAPIKLNANHILRAIDQADMDFLQANVNENNVNIADDFGWTPLMSSAFSGNKRIVEFLLKLGARRDLREKTGLTALQLAQKKQHKEIVSLLKNERAIFVDEEEKITKDRGIEELEEFYCSVCKSSFKETTIKKHEASLLHIFNTNPKLPDPLYGIPKKNKGYQMMLNTGWEESKGLGPSGSGLKYPVKTVLKRDRKGLGRGDEEKPRITHFKSNDLAAVKHVRQERIRIQGRKQIERHVRESARKERAIRRALS